MLPSPSPSSEPIRAWIDVLDELTYYELFGVAAGAEADEIRAAFHAFCDAFHPDRHFGRTGDERDAITTIFKRGTEAYLVLCDPGLRGHYDSDLATRVDSPPQRIRFSSHARPPISQVPGAARLEDAVRATAARPFARRAQELMVAGDMRQAKLQLVMANHLDPDNEVLTAALRDMEWKLKP
jgi:curved DNA-binding protein CbpA